MGWLLLPPHTNIISQRHLPLSKQLSPPPPLPLVALLIGDLPLLPIPISQRDLPLSTHPGSLSPHPRSPSPPRCFAHRRFTEPRSCWTALAGICTTRPARAGTTASPGTTTETTARTTDSPPSPSCSKVRFVCRLGSIDACLSQRKKVENEMK